MSASVPQHASHRRSPPHAGTLEEAADRLLTDHSGSSNRSRRSRSIGSRAVADGYNAIRFPSLRSEGSSYAVLDDFDTVLSPQMITPVEGQP
jgi:hypothetical protein